MHGTCSRVISVAGRTFHTTETMGDIFLAHAADILSRNETQLVPLLHEGGVEMLFVGPQCVITVTDEPVAVESSTTASITDIATADPERRVSSAA
jgi:hypothetical protein